MNGTRSQGMDATDIERIRGVFAEIIGKTHNYHGPSATSWEVTRNIIHEIRALAQDELTRIDGEARDADEHA